MKILLIGSYVYNNQQSMQRFASLLQGALTAVGHEVRLLRPVPILGRLRPAERGVGKWLGYVDRFVLFRAHFMRAVAWADVVHICDHANAVYVPWLKGKPHVVTCHDMLAIRGALGEIDGYHVRLTGRLYQKWILSGLRHAQHVVCVSRQTERELAQVSGLPSARTSVVYNALNYPYSSMSRPERARRLSALGLDPSQPFILHVGGNQWYKNRAGVVRIFAVLCQQLSERAGSPPYHLVLAGKPWPDTLVAAVRESGVSDRIHALIDVDNEDLRALYSAAECLLFPSLAEGFGWPIIEAQACGCPVATSNQKPMTEVGGDGAIYINPADVEPAAASIVIALKNTSAWCRKGKDNAGRFSVQEMLDGYVECYGNARCEAQAGHAK